MEVSGVSACNDINYNHDRSHSFTREPAGNQGPMHVKHQRSIPNVSGGRLRCPGESGGRVNAVGAEEILWLARLRYTI